MPSYEHQQLLRRIASLNEVPSDFEDYKAFVKAEDHLALLRANANDDEVIAYASSNQFFLFSAFLDKKLFPPPERSDLLSWNGNPFHLSSASYVLSWDAGGGQRAWVDRTNHWGAKDLDGARPTLFARDFDGKITIDILQEYLHLADIHWVPTQRAYCRFDDNGDYSPVVTVTNKHDNSKVLLVTFKVPDLKQYLSLTESALVQMFDFSFVRDPSSFSPSKIPESTIHESDRLFYLRRIDYESVSYTRGVHIVTTSLTDEHTAQDLNDYWHGRLEPVDIVFTALDIRNNKVADISTASGSTTNYFTAEGNSLPFETSPVFFSPEVLARYKADDVKYTVSSRRVECRGAWTLRYGTNDEEQVHVYICDLRRLPERELHYLKSFNEPPRGGLSTSTLQTDFLGQVVDVVEPLARVKQILGRWGRDEVGWWTLRAEHLTDAVNVPYAGSRKEWADEFNGLHDMVIDGFEKRFLREQLQAKGIAFDQTDQTLQLLEKAMPVPSLRTVWRIRTKVSAHVRGSTGEGLWEKALQEHESPAEHFQTVCNDIATELADIEAFFGAEDP